MPKQLLEAAKSTERSMDFRPQDTRRKAPFAEAPEERSFPFPALDRAKPGYFSKAVRVKDIEEERNVEQVRSAFGESTRAKATHE
jgi:hypothetical protein